MFFKNDFDEYNEPICKSDDLQILKSDDFMKQQWHSCVDILAERLKDIAIGPGFEMMPKVLLILNHDMSKWQEWQFDCAQELCKHYEKFID